MKFNLCYYLLHFTYWQPEPEIQVQKEIEFPLSLQTLNQVEA